MKTKLWKTHTKKPPIPGKTFVVEHCVPLRSVQPDELEVEDTLAIIVDSTLLGETISKEIITLRRVT